MLNASQRRLAADHVGLVHQVARRLAALWPNADVDELAGDGMVGLCQAAQRYKAETGVEFRSFARHAVRGAIIDGVRRRRGRAGQKWELQPGDTVILAASPVEPDFADGAIDRVTCEQLMRHDARDRRIVRLFLDGLNQAEVGRVEGIHGTAVYQRVRAAGRRRP